MVQLLIKFGANVNEQDDDINTPPHLAAQFGGHNACTTTT